MATATLAHVRHTLATQADTAGARAVGTAMQVRRDAGGLVSVAIVCAVGGLVSTSTHSTYSQSVSQSVWSAAAQLIGPGHVPWPCTTYYVPWPCSTQCTRRAS